MAGIKSQLAAWQLEKPERDYYPMGERERDLATVLKIRDVQQPCAVPVTVIDYIAQMNHAGCWRAVMLLAICASRGFGKPARFSVFHMTHFFGAQLQSAQRAIESLASDGMIVVFPGSYITATKSYDVVCDDSAIVQRDKA